MGKKRYTIISGLVCTVLAAACQAAGPVSDVQPSELLAGSGLESMRRIQTKLSGARRRTEQERYALYIDELDRMLSEIEQQQAGSEVYQETIGTIYHFENAYTGGLQASYADGRTFAFELMMTEEGSEEQQRYRCALLSDGSLWAAYQNESSARYGLPDYVVNEDVLRFSRIDFVYDDGRTDIEAEKEQRRQELKQYIAGKMSGEVQEFWTVQDRLYQIDRQEGRMIDMTDAKEQCIAAFLQEQQERLDCQIDVSAELLKIVERYKPKGYSLLWEDSWRDIAVCDLDQDGRKDLVAVLYPDDHEEVRSYADGSPYEKTPEYHAAEFWLFQSLPDGSYEPLQLSDSIGYWEDALGLIEVTFVSQGILQLEYFVGRAPFSNALLQFRYDEESRQFYVYRTYYRDGYDDSILILDAHDHGQNTTMSSYFSSDEHLEGFWQSVDDVVMQDGTHIRYYSDSLRCRCENLLEEHHINSLIWEREYELISALKRYCPSGTSEISMFTDPSFYNEKIVSGQLRLGMGDRNITLPVMVDRQRGEIVTVTGLLEKETFQECFARWSEDQLADEEREGALKEQMSRVIQERWEQADLSDSYLGAQEDILYLQIVQEGVKVGVCQEGMVSYLTIDKEYFWDTPVWRYF